MVVISSNDVACLPDMIQNHVEALAHGRGKNAMFRASSLRGW
jgi:hypothetical protein